MAKGRSVRSHARTEEQKACDEKLRSKYQATRPSLADLQRSQEYSPAVIQLECLELLEFVARLKARREALNLSLADVAAKSGIDRAAISRLENGQVENPTFGTLQRIAQALNQHLRLVLEDEPTETRS